MIDDRLYAQTAHALGYLDAATFDALLKEAGEHQAAGQSFSLRSALLERGKLTTDQDSELLALLTRRTQAAAAASPAALAIPNTAEPPAATKPETQPAESADPHAAGFTPAKHRPTLLELESGVSIGHAVGDEPAVDLPGRAVAVAEASAQAPKYAPGELLGRGGMGEVCVAVDRDLRREVAIKSILAEGNAESRRRFVEEAQITGQLEHPCIVPVHELGIDRARRPFIVMKRVRGRSLAEVLADIKKGVPVELDTAGDNTRQDSHAESGGPATERASRSGHRSRAGGMSGRRLARMRAQRGPGVPGKGTPGKDATGIGETADDAASAQRLMTRLLNAFLKVCDAVGYSHSRGVIHRDLKPENIMVGQFGEVLVMDWGLAKIIGRQSDAADRDLQDRVVTDRALDPTTQRTLDGAVAGTPAYMPPEQARGEVANLDERSDVYSLGAVLYELLACAPPVEGGSLYRVLAKVASGEIIPLKDRDTAPWTIPAELAACVKKAMALNPADRYPSVLALKHDIEAYLSGRLLAAVDYSPWQAFAKWARRNKALVGGAAATFAALLVGLGAVLAVLHDADVKAQSEAARTEIETQLASVIAREDERSQALERQREAARDLYTEGEDRFSSHVDVPFNPAAPQAYFQAHLPALMTQGRALQMFPDDGAPAELREQVASRAQTLQDQACEVGDWALASVLAESVGLWGAVDAAAQQARIVEVARMRDERAELDREMLHSVLARIRKAVNPTLGGSHGVVPVIPGEFPERARQLAAHHSRAIASEAIRLLTLDGESLENEPNAPTTDVERAFLVEILGRTGDTLADYRGVTAKALARERLLEPLDPRRTAERIAWVWAVTRLESKVPGTFGGPDGFTELLDEVTQVVQQDRGIGAEIIRALTSFAVIIGEFEIPDPAEDEAGFRLQVDALGDWLAASVKSGSEYTDALLDAAEDEANLTDQELEFVYDQFGLFGDTRPPDVDEPDRNAIAVLDRAFRSHPSSNWWLPNRPPAGFTLADFTRIRTKAIASTRNLVRLGHEDVVLELTELANDSGQFSHFSRATALTRALARPDRLPEPRSAGDFNARGQIRRHQGDLVGAREDFEAAIELDPNLVHAYSNRGNVSFSEGNMEAAIYDYTAALEIDPDAVMPLANRGIALKNLGRFDLARQDFDRIIDLKPESPTGWFNRGELETLIRNFPAAISDLTKAIEFAPGYSNAWVSRASARAQSGDLPAALDDVNRGLELRPNSPTGHLIRGNIFSGQNEFMAAITDYNKAIELNPREASAYNGRAKCRFAGGAIDAAISDYEIACELLPNDWTVHANLAWALATGDRFEEAERVYEEAFEMAPQQSHEYLRGAHRHFFGE